MLLITSLVPQTTKRSDRLHQLEAGDRLSTEAFIAMLTDLKKLRETAEQYSCLGYKGINFTSIRKGIESNVNAFIKYGSPVGMIVLRKFLMANLDEEVDDTMADIQRALCLAASEWMSEAHRHPAFLGFARKHLSNVISQWVYRVEK